MNKLLLLLASIVLCAIVYFFSTLLKQPEQQGTHAQSDTLETYIHGADMQQFSAKGKVKNQVVSPLITKMTDSTRIHMQTPSSSFHLKKDWTITADEGQFDTTTAVFSAIGHVLIKRTDGVVRMQTSRLNYNIDTHIASTNQSIDLKTLQGEIHAVGMTADLDNETLELHQQIETHYDSPNR